jgi:hypothetical protein
MEYYNTVEVNDRLCALQTREKGVSCRDKPSSVFGFFLTCRCTTAPRKFAYISVGVNTNLDCTPPPHVGKGIILTSYLPEGEDEGIYKEALKLADAVLP